MLSAYLDRGSVKANRRPSTGADAGILLWRPTVIAEHLQTQARFFRPLACLLFVLAAFVNSGWADNPPARPAEEWKKLPPVDGNRWVRTGFGTGGNIEIREDSVFLGYGDPLTGVTYKGDFPKDNYEVRFEARRLSGFDFFVGLTFPVGEEHCSLILGGWAGYLSGFSTIDGYDASENLSTQEGHYDNDRWYKIRVAVTEERLTAYVDEKLLCEVPRKDHKFDIRAEVGPSRPLGFATYSCDAEFRNFRYRKITNAVHQDANSNERRKR